MKLEKEDKQMLNLACMFLVTLSGYWAGYETGWQTREEQKKQLAYPVQSYNPFTGTTTTNWIIP